MARTLAASSRVMCEGDPAGVIRALGPPTCGERVRASCSGGVCCRSMRFVIHRRRTDGDTRLARWRNIAAPACELCSHSISTTMTFDLAGADADDACCCCCCFHWCNSASTSSSVATTLASAPYGRTKAAYVDMPHW